MFQIIYSKKALKFLEKQEKATQIRLTKAISKLPLEGDILRMKGTDGYRLRVGSFRILFDVHGIIVDIIKIDNRGQVYKGA